MMMNPLLFIVIIIDIAVVHAFEGTGDSCSSSRDCISGDCKSRCCKSFISSRCQTCSSSGSCSSCESGYQLSGSDCEAYRSVSDGDRCSKDSNCESGECLDSRCCKSSISQCTSCDSSGNCDKCSSGYGLVSGSCRYLARPGELCTAGYRCRTRCGGSYCCASGVGTSCQDCDTELGGLCQSCPTNSTLMSDKLSCCLDPVDSKCTYCGGTDLECSVCASGYEIAQNETTDRTYCRYIVPPGEACTLGRCQYNDCRGGICCDEKMDDEVTACAAGTGWAEQCANGWIAKPAFRCVSPEAAAFSTQLRNSTSSDSFCTNPENKIDFVRREAAVLCYDIPRSGGGLLSELQCTIGSADFTDMIQRGTTEKLRCADYVTYLTNEPSYQKCATDTELNSKLNLLFNACQELYGKNVTEGEVCIGWNTCKPGLNCRINCCYGGIPEGTCDRCDGTLGFVSDLFFEERQGLCGTCAPSHTRLNSAVCASPAATEFKENNLKEPPATPEVCQQPWVKAAAETFIQSCFDTRKAFLESPTDDFQWSSSFFDKPSILNYRDDVEEVSFHPLCRFDSLDSESFILVRNGTEILLDDEEDAEEYRNSSSKDSIRDVYVEKSFSPLKMNASCLTMALNYWKTLGREANDADLPTAETKSLRDCYNRPEDRFIYDMADEIFSKCYRTAGASGFGGGGISLSFLVTGLVAIVVFLSSQ